METRRHHVLYIEDHEDTRELVTSYWLVASALPDGSAGFRNRWL